MGHAEGGSFVQLLFDRLDDGGVAMSGHQRAETKVVIDIFVAVHVVNAAALSILHEERIGFVVAIVAGNAKRDAFEGPLMGGCRFRRSFFVGGDFFL